MEKIQAAVIHSDDIEEYSEERLQELFEKHHELIIEFPTNDKLILKLTRGESVKHGPYHVLEILYGQLEENDEDDELSYGFYNLEYHKPSLLIDAIRSFKKHANDEDFNLVSAPQFHLEENAESVE